MEMRAKADMKRIEAETAARAKVERENQDLYLEQIRLKSKETRSTVMEGIKTAGTVLGAGAEAFLKDWDKVTAAAAGISLLALGVYTAKRGTGVIASFVSARLGKPSLVRETSRFSVFETAKHPIKTIQQLRKTPQVRKILFLYAQCKTLSSPLSISIFKADLRTLKRPSQAH